MTILKKLTFTTTFLSFFCFCSANVTSKDIQPSLSPVEKLSQFLATKMGSSSKKGYKDSEMILNFIQEHPKRIKEILSSSEIDPRVFLVFSIEASLKKYPISHFDEHELSDYILEESKELQLKWDSQIYHLNKDELLFIWQKDRGNQNHDYWVWRISIKDDTFKPFLYRIHKDEEDLGEKTKKIDHEIRARSITYNPTNNMIVVSSNAGIPNGNYVTETQFKLEEDQLIWDTITKTRGYIDTETSKFIKSDTVVLTEKNHTDKEN